MSSVFRSQAKPRNSSVPRSRSSFERQDSGSIKQVMSCQDLESCDDEYSNEGLDPRVQDELEKLNACTDEINQLENQLEDANCLFRVLLTDSTQQLKAVAKKIGSSAIEKARPFYEAQETAKKAQQECQAAATAYQRAYGVHAAAKETITLAEARFLTNSKDWEFDNAWQEMLNHATMAVMAAEKQKKESEAEHLKRAAAFQAAEQEVQQLQRKLHRYIQSSQPYFEQKEIFNRALESQKERVQELQAKISASKDQYSRSLRKLELISESIHERRRMRRLISHPAVREPGVGAELDYDLDTCDIASSRSTTSGQSASKFGSEFDSADGLDAPDGASSNELAKLSEKFQGVSLAPVSFSISRTASSPALSPQQPLNVCDLKDQNECEDLTVTDLDLESNLSRIML